VNFAHGGFQPGAEAYPNLTGYLTRMHSRPSFAACIAEETAMLDKVLKRAG